MRCGFPPAPLSQDQLLPEGSGARRRELISRRATAVFPGAHPSGVPPLYGWRSLQGFLSYRPHWTGEGPLAGDSLYITTVCVPKELRGRGIATELYCALEQKESSPGEPCAITIRTWSTNLAQIALLEKLGYHAALRIQDDRGPGIDTIYFRKMLED